MIVQDIGMQKKPGIYRELGWGGNDYKGQHEGDGTVLCHDCHDFTHWSKLIAWKGCLNLKINKNFKCDYNNFSKVSYKDKDDKRFEMT